MTMLEERTMMAMAAETMPRLRLVLCVMKRKDEWTVWELSESVPPSTARELACNKGPRAPERESSSAPVAESQEQFLPFVMEESNGEEPF